MLLYVDGRVIEIRPGEKFISSELIDLRFLELEKPIKKQKYDSSSTES